MLKTLSKKTPEFKTVMKSFDHTVSILSQREKWTVDPYGTYLKEVQNTLKQNLLDNFQTFGHEEQRLVMGNHLVDKGFPKLLFEFYVHVFDNADIKAVDNKLAHEAFDEDGTLIVLMTIREIFWNFSESCPAFSKAVAKTRLFEYLIQDLSAIKDGGLEVLDEDSDPFAFNSAIAILHNCASNPDTERSIYHEVKAVDNLLPFLESKQPKIQMVTLLALASMIDENECDKIQGNEKVFHFLRNMINEAREALDRRKDGFCVCELIDGLSKLAKAEKNKILIMDTKPLGIFRKVLEDGHEKELAAVCHVVRELALDKNNIGKIKKEIVLCRKLIQLRTHTNEDIRISAGGAIFQLELDDSTTAGTPHDLSDEETHETGSDVDVDGLANQDKRFPKRLSEGKLPLRSPHILISYNNDNLKEIRKIRDHLLDRKYNVWLDSEHMHTSMLDAMTESVENAVIVLVCFSEKYKCSQNCRAEAEFASLMQKEIIPLKMQMEYNPDGWLAILLGSRPYYDFSGKYNFEDKFKELLNAIEKLPSSAPEIFFHCLESKLGLDSLEDIMNLSNALEHLVV